MIIISVIIITITPHYRASASWARNKSLPYHFNRHFDSTYRHLNLHMLLTLLHCTLVNEFRGKGKGKGKRHPCTGTEALYRPYGPYGCRDIALLFLDHGTRRGWGFSVTPRPLFTLRKTLYSLYRRLDGPQGRSGQVRKFSPPLGFDPRTVQPVASRYTDSATRHTHLRVLRSKHPFMLGCSYNLNPNVTER